MGTTGPAGATDAMGNAALNDKTDAMGNAALIDKTDAMTATGVTYLRSSATKCRTTRSPPLSPGGPGATRCAQNSRKLTPPMTCCGGCLIRA